MELKGIDEKVVEKVGEEGYFTRDKAENKKGEDQFFRQGEMPKVGLSHRIRSFPTALVECMLMQDDYRRRR